MTDSVIARLEKSAIIQVIHEEPTFSEMFIAHLLGRAIRVEADLVDQLFNSSGTFEQATTYFKKALEHDPNYDGRRTSYVGDVLRRSSAACA